MPYLAHIITTMNIKYLAITILLTLSKMVSAQSAIELERKIYSGYLPYELPDEKLQIARQLLSIDPANQIGNQYLRGYYKECHPDSLTHYWDNLIAEHPGKAWPYIARSRFTYDDFPKYADRKPASLSYLHQALYYYPDDPAVVYEIATIYYQDFIWPLRIERNIPALEEEDDDQIKPHKKASIKSTYPFAADSALYYFYKAMKKSDGSNDCKLYFPIRQLEGYLGITPSAIDLNIDSLAFTDYFPLWYFMPLPANWMELPQDNLVWELESSERSVFRYTRQLKRLNEPGLYTKQVDSGVTIYRFTWLRSFHHPVSIRLECHGDKHILYWKEGKGAGGYAPKSIKRNGKKRLNIREAKACLQMIDSMQLDTLPHVNYMLKYDGATWVLERKVANGYKAYSTNIPDQKFQQLALLLLKYTNIRVKKDDFY